MFPAEDLKVGVKVLLSDGSYGIIEAVRVIHYDESQTTYNFEVADFHTYYVGNGVLVHNMNCKVDAVIEETLNGKNCEWGRNYLHGRASYVVGEGFVEAKDLNISDKLLLSSGKCVTIEKLEVETLETAENTYNFEVADFHTYYVSESNVLVHNDCISKELTKIANKYDDFQCVECVDEMKKYLLSKGKNYLTFNFRG